MIQIKLGFLLGLPLSHSQETSSENASTENNYQKESKTSKKSAKTSKISTKDSKKSKKSNDTRTSGSSKKPFEKQPLPDYAYDVGKPKGFFHIEYKLFPHLEACHIDVVHWEVISKIFLENNTVIYKNLIRDNTIWIPIMLEHKIYERLSDVQLIGLKNSVLEFVVTANKKKMCSEAKNEKTKLFFIRQDDLLNEHFVEAFDNDPNVTKTSKIESNVSKGINKPFKKSGDASFKLIYSIIMQHDHTLHCHLKKILNKLELHEEISCNKFIPPPPEPLPETIEDEMDENDVNNYTWPKFRKVTNKTKKDKNSKKSDKTNKSAKSKKSNKPDKATKLKKEAKIKVNAENYFTDCAMCTYRLNEEVDKIKDLFVSFSVWNLTTPQKLIELKPVVIKLKTLMNLPVDYLIEQKFSSVYFQYNIPNIARHVTQAIILQDLKNLKKNKEIFINESHIFFDIPLPEFSYFLMCDRFFVEMIGVYDNEPDRFPSIYGSEKRDLMQIAPKPCELIYEKPKNIILAVACYDLSLLMHSRKDLELNESLRHPTNSNSLRANTQNKNLDFIQTFSSISIENIHLNFRNDHFPSPLLDGILFDEETSLSIQVSLGFKLDSFVVTEDPVIKYKRLLLIVYDLDIAAYLLSEFLCYNQQYSKSVLFKNYKMFATNLKHMKDIDSSGQILTGFWIDSGNSVIIFLESCATNYCMEFIVHQMKNVNESLCRIYHNSVTFYYNRIYENFLALGGIYAITLRYELKKIFNAKWTHISTSVPKPAFETIKKLQYLLEMPSMRIISQHGAFPTVNELISFDMEFGVPHFNDKLY